jgi:hypothetical protein
MIPHSYTHEQVICLLSPYRGDLLSVTDKEQRLKAGDYYGDLLSAEELPQPDYLRLFDHQMATLAGKLAPYVLRLADRVNADRPSGPLALVSLARAGTPIGVVLADLLRHRHGRTVTHYTASVIHKYGFDPHALAYLLDRHAPQDLLFLDGWVSQGRITRALQDTLAPVAGVDSTLYCLSDPSGIQDATATRKDLLLPSAVLNAAVSGLMSRTVHNPDGFDFSAHYPDHAPVDRTQAFVADMLAAVAVCPGPATEPVLPGALQRPLAQAQIQAWCTEHHTTADRIKAGIGEVSRSLLRRTPSLVAVDRGALDEAAHLQYLADQHGVPLQVTDLAGPYRAFSILD